LLRIALTHICKLQSDRYQIRHPKTWRSGNETNAAQLRLDNYRQNNKKLVNLPVVQERFGAKREWHVGPGADLRGANFRSVDLRGVDMSGADLTNAIFNEANLAGASLDRAILCDAILFRAVLFGVSAVGADFRGATLRESELHGANLSAAIIDVGECEAAFGSESTILPPGRSVIFADLPDDPSLGNSSWGGGYRLLRPMLDDDALGQPLVPLGATTTNEISDELQTDLMASLVRVLDEAIQVNWGDISRFGTELNWYSSGDCMLRGNPHVTSYLSDFLVRYLDVRFEAVESDGSVLATFKPDKDAVNSFIRHTLISEHEQHFEEDADDESDIGEVDVTVKSVDQFLKRFDYCFDVGFEPRTISRYWLKPGKRKTLIATLNNSSGDSLLIEVAASIHGLEIATSLWSTYEDIGEDPHEKHVNEVGWTFEMELDSEESESVEPVPVDEETIQQIRELYNPVALSQCGRIEGFEMWEGNVSMAKVVLSLETSSGESVVGSTLKGQEVLQALLDEAIAAYVLTRCLTDDGEDVDADSDDDVSPEDEIDDEFDDDSDEDEIDDEFDDEVSGEVEDDAENTDVDVDDLMEKFIEAVEALCEVRPAVAETWGHCDYELYPARVLERESFDFPDSRWQYIAEAALQNVLYLRSCRELIDALGILDIEQRDSHTFALRMKPQTKRRFHPSYEWIPPSQWNAN